MTDIAWRIIASILIAVACLLTGYVHGLHVEQGREAQRAIAQVAAARTVELQLRRTVQASAVQAAAQQAQTRVVYRTITKEVIRYAQTDAGRAACLDPEWVHQHDAAAVPASAPTASEPVAATGPVTNADALGVVTSNYEQCNAWRQQVIDWQNWYRASGLAQQ